MKKIITFLLSLPFAFAGMKESGRAFADSFQSGNVLDILLNFYQFFVDVFAVYRINRGIVIVLGVFVIALIVIKIQNMIENPKKNKEQVKKENEEKEFEEILQKSETKVDKLKDKFF